MPPLEVKKKTRMSALTAAVENASLQTKSAFEQMMQQKAVTEEFELKLHREEHEYGRHEREEERRRQEEERYEDRRRREEELIELRRKESQQQQQMNMFMQLGMTAMMAYMGVKLPKPDDDNESKR